MTTSDRTKLWYLRRLDLFAGMTEADLVKLAGAMHDHRYPAGTELLAVNHDGHDRVYLVKEGAIRLHAASPERDVTVAILGPGRVFGRAALLGRSGPIGVRTLAPSYICHATWTGLMVGLAGHTAIALRMMRLLADSLVRAETWVARYHADTPLATLLLELSDEFGPTASASRSG